MFAMTDAAGGYLARMLKEARAPKGTAIRIVREEDKLKPKLDRPRAGDLAYDHAGTKVLLMDPKVSSMLETSILDVEQTQDGTKLIILNG
ncbi:MAG: hypothetical protein HYS35_00685 [Betaproteobacteria bacterium]|nr:hypothetical protein [Betaproteobacteria bacterium]